jgi:rod shape-determining protein MreD
MGAHFVDVDVVTVMIGYLLIYSGRAGACVYAFLLGMLIDFFSAGVIGVFTLVYVLVFLTIEWGSRFFDLTSVKGQMILVFAGALVREMSVVGLLDILAYQIHFSFSLFLGFAVSAAITGIVAPFIFSFFEWLRAMLSGRLRESS